MPSEQAIWMLTQKINLRGVPVDMELVDLLADKVALRIAKLEEEAKSITGGIKSSQRAEIVSWAAEESYLMEGYTAQDVQHALNDENCPEKVRRVLEIRAATSKTSTAKYKKIQKIVAEDGTLKHTLTYHGAATGRFSSRGGLNVQNIARPLVNDVDLALEAVKSNAEELLWDEPMDVYASLVRSVICAPEGKTFIDADFSGIENRVAAWVSDDTDTLKRFHEGMDQYIDFATEMYHCKHDEVSSQQRQIAKSAVLGCVYGQGWKGFIRYAERFGLKIAPKESQEIVGHFRRVYSKTANLWRTMGKKAVKAMENPGKEIRVNKYLKFKKPKNKNWLLMFLPSKRSIFFYKPQVEKRAMAREKGGDWTSFDPELVEKLDQEKWDSFVFDTVTAMTINTQTRQWCRNDLPGYTLFQSAVQGIARDFLVHAMLDVEANGFEVVMTVHDEIIALVDEDDVREDEFMQIMSDVPEWAEGFPLASEGWVGKRYRK